MVIGQQVVDQTHQDINMQKSGYVANIVKDVLIS